MELKRSKEEALQASQARSNFISSISHELRTPLNSIINFTDQVIEDFDEMLSEKDLQDEMKGYLQRVLINSRHLLQLINDLLEFTKAEAGKMDYKLEENDLNVIVKSAYNNTYLLLNGTDVRFDLKLNETPLIAMVDSRRFLQILLNLLSNAIKFTKKGNIELRSFDDANHITIEIEDTGKGIPLKKQRAIFEPFVQADSNDSGTGLGLGLVKRMCDDMGIEITLNSQEDIGSIFALHIKKAGA
jgi:signal transduction histidine kinase